MTEILMPGDKVYSVVNEGTEDLALARYIVNSIDREAAFLVALHLPSISIHRTEIWRKHPIETMRHELMRLRGKYTTPLFNALQVLDASPTMCTGFLELAKSDIDKINLP